MVCNTHGSVSIGDEVGNAVIFLQRTPLFTPKTISIAAPEVASAIWASSNSGGGKPDLTG